MTDAFITAAVRTPVGRNGGALSEVRADDLAALAVRACVDRAGLDPARLDDVILGCTNQAGEDKDWTMSLGMTAEKVAREYPIPATQRALQRAGLTIDQIDLIELNEAFAAQALACIKVLEMDPDRVNVYGGAIAMGHALGSSGSRLLTTLVHALHRRQARYGLVTMCIGVGQGIAMIVERV
jgi:acetyl-CoA acetyltransferase